MTAYEYDNLPEELRVEPLADTHFEEALAILQYAMVDSPDAREAKIAYIYDRKDYMEADAIQGPYNESYNCSKDEVVVQIAVRFRPPTDPNSRFVKLKETLVEEREEAIRAAAEAELAALEADEIKLNERKAALKAKLAK